MTFDAWQILLNFGTKPLDENERIFKSTNSEVDGFIRSGMLVYGRITAHVHAAFDRGFYFQPVLLEFNLGDYLETLAKEPSVISLAGIKGFKHLKDLDGKDLRLPFFPVNILVNRTLFGAQRPREDEEVWLNNLTERRRAIAHELLFAKQYAEYYDLETDSMVQAVSTPTKSEEDELMCPSHAIERSLNFFETEHGMHLFTAGGFVDADPSFLKAYHRFWLREYAVSRSVCNEQTELYLEKGVRSHIRTNANEIAERISRIIGQPTPSSQHFQASLKDGHPNAVELQALCRDIATQFKTDHETVVVSIARVLDLRNGGGI